MMVAVSRVVMRDARHAWLTLGHLFRDFSHDLGFKVTRVFSGRTKLNWSPTPLRNYKS